MVAVNGKDRQPNIIVWVLEVDPTSSGGKGIVAGRDHSEFDGSIRKALSPEDVDGFHYSRERRFVDVEDVPTKDDKVSIKLVGLLENFLKGLEGIRAAMLIVLEYTWKIACLIGKA